jgi:methionyl-tRNA formyltransferase
MIEQPVPRSRFLKNRARKLGWPTVFGQVLFSTLMLPHLRKASAPRRQEILREFSMEIGPISEEIVTHVDSVNDGSSIDTLKQFKPDLVLLCGTRIVARRVLESVPATFINIHAGITPLYRGVHGAYWALVQQQPDACGVTVHLVDPGIDTGSILAHDLIHPSSSDTFATYPLLQLGAGLRLLKEVIQRLSAGERWKIDPPYGKSALWSHPTLRQYLKYRTQLGVK